MPIIENLHDNSTNYDLWYSIIEILEDHCNWKNISRNIAYEFWKEYGHDIFGYDMSMDFVRSIVNNQFTEYAMSKNNCQTMVSDLVFILTNNFKIYMEPLRYLNYEKLEVIFGQKQASNLVKETFNKYGLNNKLNFLEFELKYKLDYFGIFTDEETKDALSRENIGNLRSMYNGEKYLKQLDKFSEKICGYHNINSMAEQYFINEEDNKEQEYNKEDELDNDNEQELSQVLFFSTKKIEIEEIDSEASFGRYNIDFSIQFMLHLMYNDIKQVSQIIKAKKMEKDPAKKKNMDKNKSIIKQRLEELSHRHSKISILSRNARQNEANFNEVEEQRKVKYIRTGLFQELNFIYYNNIRAVMLTKSNNIISYIGVLFVKNQILEN